MSFSFNAQQGLIIVRAELWGPSGSAVLQLALDTGATGTVVNVGMLVAVGYDPALMPDRIQVTTGSSVEFVPRVILEKIEALGQARMGFPVLCHTLPPSAGVDGLLGLDFFRAQCLTILEAVKKHFVDTEEGSRRVVKNLIHAPHSPSLGMRIWPPA